MRKLSVLEKVLVVLMSLSVLVLSTKVLTDNRVVGFMQPVGTPAPVITDSMLDSTLFYGAVINPAREVLEASWTDSVESGSKGYCARRVRYYHEDSVDSYGGKAFLALVIEVVPADTANRKMADAGLFSCPRYMPLIHTHPPITCRQFMAEDSSQILSCAPGGLDAYQCAPSREDYAALIKTGEPFGAIQCDRHAIVFYWAQSPNLDSITTPDE